MPKTPLHEQDPSRAAYVRALAPYIAALDELARQITLKEAYLAGGTGTAPTVGAVERARARVAKVIQEAQITADVVARRDVIAAARRLSGGRLAPSPAIPVTTSLPEVPFTEAVADLMAREPRLANSAADVARAYNEQHGFSMARAVEQKTVERVQKALAKAVHEGQTVDAGVRTIQAIARKAGEDMADWTRSYAETVFRTNVSTAYSAGRFRQMADPDVAKAIGALRYSTAGDVDVRKNHKHADGLIAAADDPVWQRLAPPLGYNCRCGVDFVSWPELERKGLVQGGTVRRSQAPRGAHADSGFTHTGRPDVMIYGGL